ncbi:secretory pathway protein Sec39-domain-containing protein [Lentinula boryana]|uniref:Secretory pathway protein Sec39-domain-containing protein n=1 Tax=Lentinula boryana TaxID=40481 RepID=A0ABQ8QVD6_9AGAR|nr:secretory pathway protein Sec39-domain-containing protein [Lentinula boryana]
MPSSAYTRWTELTDEELTVNNVQDALKAIPDDLWVSAACTDRLVDDLSVQRVILEVGLERTQPTMERVKNLLPSEVYAEETSVQTLTDYFKELPVDAQLCHFRAVLLKRLDRLNTYVEICKELPSIPVEEDKEMVDEDPEWEDDPWAESDAGPVTLRTTTAPPPVTLSDFLTTDLLHSAFILAIHQWFSALRTLLYRHGAYLWPHRFTILEHIPAYVNPTDYHFLLPSCDTHTNSEQRLDASEWRSENDISELPHVHLAIQNSDALSVFDAILDPQPLLPPPEAEADLLDAEGLSRWYQKRVQDIMEATGMVDVVLTLIQHGASQNVPHLDELGEDLSLLSKLVYDAPRGHEIDEDWTLTRWRAMDPSAVIRAYLAHSTPLSLPHDIAHLVMPYLFVLESRAERTGKPDPQLPDRLLHQFILQAPLEMVLSIFEVSKPTLPVAQRVIKQEPDMVRLALACLYGNDSLDEWATMSGIFECLPVWDIPADDEEEDAADTTITSLGAFVTPSTSRPRVTPSDLLVFFNPLPLSSLSRALDILDVHLESGEIFARWSVPAPLRWFLQSSNNVAEQRAWANRMARRAGGSDHELTTQEDWEWLLEDMLKLAGETKIKGAFGLLSRDDIVRIYFSGLLSTGSESIELLQLSLLDVHDASEFEVAKNLLRNTTQLNFDSETLEDICLACSHEFYDNASLGNYKFGEMKLAYECLDVPPLSNRLLKEKEFIEATSRLSSFNIMSRPGIPISPIEIRLTKDRLSLVSRVLSSNADAYKHTEVILDLVYKLGFRDNIVAEVKALAMLADTALQAEDFGRAYETCQRMIDTVLNLRATLMGMDDPRVRDTSEVCWVACFQLGRQTEFDDVDKKLVLLGRAIEICPPDRLHDVLTAWRRLEKEDLEIRQERLETSHNGAVKSVQSKNTKSIPKTTASSLQARLRDFHMPSPPLLSTPDARALASKTFNTVAANFPFSVGHRGRSQFSQLSQGDERSRSGSRRRPDSDDVQTQASRVFSKGIGWLIGAEENS